MLNKKLLAAAIVGALVAGNAVAGDLAENQPTYYAKEIKLPNNLVATGDSALIWTLGWNFSNNELKYARVELTGDIEFDPASTVLVDIDGDLTTAGDQIDTVVGAVNGLGTNLLVIPITSGSTAGTDKVTADSKIIIASSAAGHEVTSYADVNAQVALYDQASQAQAGGTATGSGLVQGTYANGPYIKFAQSYALTAEPNILVANVSAATGVYFEFLADAGTTPPTTTTDGTLADSLAVTLVDPDGATGPQTATFDVAGVPVTLATLLDLAASEISVDGAYGFSSDLTLGGVSAPAFDADEETQVFDAQAVAPAPLVITATGTDAILAGDYLASLDAVSADPANYVVSDITNVLAGTIKRNGVELQAPLVQVPGGWISRIALTNTGGADRKYAIKVLNEEGNVVSTANLTGTVKKNSTYVINDLNTVLTGFTAAPRATIVVTVEAPDAAGTGTIQGLYQIVNPTSGSISNHVMVRPGTN